MNQHSTIDAAVLSFADVLEWVESATDLDGIQRRDYCSNIRAIASWLDLPPASIGTDGATLRPLLARLHHKQIGVSRKRVQNAISSVTSAIRKAAATRSSTRRARFRTPAWKARLASCPQPWDRLRLTRLATYCSEHRIEEADVDDTVLMAWCEDLERESLLKDPENVRKLAIYSWNGLIDEGIAPHLRRLTPPRSGVFWTTPLSEFREDFQADLALWIDRLEHVDLFSDDGPPKALRPTSLDNIRVAVRHAASALVLSGVPMDSIRSLSVLTEFDHFVMILRFFIRRNDGKVPTWLYGMASKLVAIARHHVRLPNADLARLVARKEKVKVKRSGLTGKNNERLGQFEDPRNVILLVQLPAVVAARVQSRGNPSRWDALDVMYALTIDMLLQVPMRRSNLASLDVARHIRWRGHGAGRYAALSIPEEEVKNGVGIEADLPKETSRLLRLWLDQYRPLVSAAPGTWVFPKASGGGHRAPSTVSTALFRFIKRETGLDVNAHLFRHLAGMLYLMRFPGQYEVVRRMLGHSQIATTVSFYTSLESKWALKRYDETILADWRSRDDTD